jgi:beta-glucosidase
LSNSLVNELLNSSIRNHKNVTNIISENQIEERIEHLISQMSLAEKVGQMTQVEKNSISPEDVTNYAIGSVLSGGGGNPSPNNPENWAKMVEEFAEAALKTRLGIPMIYGVDAVHGHNNMKDATIFPHNVGLGASRDADLVKRIAQATAREILATNVHWNFAPAVTVPQDIRWGRAFEGFSEDTALVTELGLAYMEGLHNPELGDAWVLESVKHFVGDGATGWGTTKPSEWLTANNWQAASPNWKLDQGNAILDEATLREKFISPYVEAIKAGALNIMVSFSSWNGEKMHGNKHLLTGILKEEYGFEGFLVSDWMAIDQLDQDFYNCVVKAINAGLDMIMVPYDFKRFVATLTSAAEKGDISAERIDDAVRRILLVKAKLGLFDNPLTDRAWLAHVGSNAHRALAREAVQKTAVLLKNEKATLPLPKDGLLFLAGEAANDIGLACGGWTIQWQGEKGQITTGKTLLAGLIEQEAGEVIYQANGNFSGKADVGIVVVNEGTYAEGIGDRPDLGLSQEDKDLIARVRAVCDKLLLVIYSGRPLIITDVLEDCDAVVAAFYPGSEANALADNLNGKAPFTAKLSYSWPRSMAQVPVSVLKADKSGPLYPFGYGLSL